MSVVRAFLLGASACLSLSSVLCFVCVYFLVDKLVPPFFKGKNPVPRMNRWFHHPATFLLSFALSLGPFLDKQFMYIMLWRPFTMLQVYVIEAHFHYLNFSRLKLKLSIPGTLRGGNCMLLAHRP